MASLAQPYYGLSDREYSRSRRTATLPDRATLVGSDQPPLVVVEYHPGPEASDWFESVLEEFERIINLPPDWDGYGSEAIAPETAIRAAELLMNMLGPRAASPWVVPLSDGGIQLEWKANDSVIEIEVPARESAAPTAFYQDEATGVSWEGIATDIPHDLLASVLER